VTLKRNPRDNDHCNVSILSDALTTHIYTSRSYCTLQASTRSSGSSAKDPSVPYQHPSQPNDTILSQGQGHKDGDEPSDSYMNRLIMNGSIHKRLGGNIAGVAVLLAKKVTKVPKGDSGVSEPSVRIFFR
jgi:hypothetical protein